MERGIEGWKGSTENWETGLSKMNLQNNSILTGLILTSEGQYGLLGVSEC